MTFDAYHPGDETICSAGVEVKGARTSPMLAQAREAIERTKRLGTTLSVRMEDARSTKLSVPLTVYSYCIKLGRDSENKVGFFPAVSFASPYDVDYKVE
jgi:hypothetical protein